MDTVINEVKNMWKVYNCLSCFISPQFVSLKNPYVFFLFCWFGLCQISKQNDQKVPSKLPRSWSIKSKRRRFNPKVAWGNGPSAETERFGTWLCGARAWRECLWPHFLVVSWFSFSVWPMLMPYTYTMFIHVYTMFAYVCNVLLLMVRNLSIGKDDKLEKEKANCISVLFLECSDGNGKWGHWSAVCGVVESFEND